MRNKIHESKIKEVDWDFQGSKTQYLTHKYHTYPARFIPQIPKTSIKYLAKKKDSIIFDIFSGCGTTLVESRLSNNNAVGTDMNEIATLLSHVKSTPLNIDKLAIVTKKLLEKISKSKNNDLLPNHLNEESLRSVEYIKNKKRIREYIFNGIKSRKIHQNFFSELTNIFNTIDKENNKDFKKFFQVAFSTTLNNIKNSKTKKVLTKRPIQIFSKNLNKMLPLMGKFTKKTNKKNWSKVFNVDSRDLNKNLTNNQKKYLDSNMVDLIVTSPPYANALDYHREHKFNLFWLGYKFYNLKKKEIGAHSKFCTNRLRMLSQYLSDELRVMSEMARTLKIGKKAVVVIGNSSVEHLTIPSHKHHIKAGKLVGLDLKYNLLRNIDPCKKATGQHIGNINDEYVLIFEKVNYVKPSKDEIISFVDTIMSGLLKDLEQNKEEVFDIKTLKSTYKRLSSKKEISFKECKQKYLERNIAKYEDAIRNISRDIFKDD